MKGSSLLNRKSKFMPKKCFEIDHLLTWPNLTTSHHLKCHLTLAINNSHFSYVIFVKETHFGLFDKEQGKVITKRRVVIRVSEF